MSALNPIIEVGTYEQKLSIKVTTPHLEIFSVLDETYLPQITELYGSKEVNRLVGDGSTLESDKVHEKVRRWIQRWSDQNPFAGYIVREKETHQLVGILVLKRFKDKNETPHKIVPGVVEVGYISMPQFWNKKYTQEMGRALCTTLLPHLQKNFKVVGQLITRIVATAAVDNGASKAVLSKFMTYLGDAPRYNSPRSWYQLDLELLL